MSLLSMIGNTPVIQLANFCNTGTLLAKLEFRNPGFSVKDRIALAMIEDAEKKGLLRSGDTIVESTSGNTGIGLAWIGKLKGYRVVLCMPKSMSLERRAVLAMLGAEIRLSPAEKGMKGAVEMAREVCLELGGWSACQFDNPANVQVHYQTTGPEIFQATGGNLDFFVAGVGTGGTISGAGMYLKEKNSKIQLIAVEPAASAVLSGGSPAPHPIQGIGAGFIPSILNQKILDRIEKVDGVEAIEAAREVAHKEGLLVGISSGANLAVARRILNQNLGATVVTILCDAGERYLSTNLYKEHPAVCVLP